MFIGIASFVDDIYAMHIKLLHRSFSNDKALLSSTRISYITVKNK